MLSGPVTLSQSKDPTVIEPLILVRLCGRLFLLNNLLFKVLQTSVGRLSTMAGSTFQTNPFDLDKLLEDCHRGVFQLPDFQRSWVWDEDRIKSLIASVSRAFPVGVLMSLDTGGPVNFKPRPVEGAPTEAKRVPPQSLLLDGQQRMAVPTTQRSPYLPEVPTFKEAGMEVAIE